MQRRARPHDVARSGDEVTAVDDEDCIVSHVLVDAREEVDRIDELAAGERCGITVPTGERRAKVRAWWDGLSPDQQSCLKEADLTRPIGPLSKAERQKLRTDVAAAAKICTVTLPK